MAFALLIIGVVMIVAAVRDTVTELIVLVATDFTGPTNFVYWVVALLVIGSIGYFERLKGLSDALLALVILVLVLNTGDPNKRASGGFFKQFSAAIAQTQSASPVTALSTTSGGSQLINVTGPGGISISV